MMEIFNEAAKILENKWVKDWIYDPEEPPMFGHYVCTKCYLNSAIEPTGLTIRVLREQFGLTVEEWAKKVNEKENRKTED